MSTIKTTNLQHPSATSPNLILDSSGSASLASTPAQSTSSTQLATTAFVNGVGKILKHSIVTTVSGSVTTGYVFAWIPFSYTPVFSNCKLMIRVIGFFGASGNGSTGMWISQNGSSTNTNTFGANAGHGDYNSGGYGEAPICLTAIYSPPYVNTSYTISKNNDVAGNYGLYIEVFEIGQ